jgi:hypothetical protein
LDVALDPTTYVTGGTSTLVKKQAATSAARVTAKAKKAGLTDAQAAKMGERAAKQTAKKANDARGLDVRFAGQSVPGVTRATAKVSKGARKVPVPRKVKAGTRKVASEVRPMVRADKTVSRAEHREIRRAARTTRYSTSREIDKAKLRAKAIRSQLKGRDREVIDAIEAGTVKSLPADLRPLAKRLEDQFKYARRLERRAGLNVAKRERYVPHALSEELKEGAGIVSTGARKPRGSFQKQRKDARSLAEIRKLEPGKFSEDLPVLYANRMAEGARTSKKADLNRKLMDMGRQLKKGDDVTLKAGEKVYRVRGSDIAEPSAREVERFLDGGHSATREGGRYVILNENVVEQALKVSRVPERTQIGALFDSAQGKWKWLATQPNPGFHLRNLIGDTQNAYLAERPDRLAGNLRQSRRALKRLNAQEKNLLLGKKLDPDGKGLKINGQTVSYDDLVKEAESVGAIRAGFATRELDDLASKARTTKSGETVGEGIRKVGRGKGTKRLRASQVLKNRDDVVRLATYIGGRKRGLSPEKAAERSSKYHFDYGDLTDFERRVMRRLMPFYTFSSRNIPLQFKSYFGKPGKYANYQKAREEFAKAFGVDLDEAERNMAESEQRSAPFVAKWKGQEFTLSLGPSGLPLTDLNELPVSKNPGAAADEWMNRAVSMLTPAAKTPVELWSNFSFFFRDQIERETGPLVAAPSFVSMMPEDLRKELGVVDDYVDPRSGEKTWGWPAKVDYVAHQLPGPINFINRLATPSDRKGQNTAEKAVAYAGVRVTPIDPVSTRIQKTYEKRAELGKELAGMRQRKHPSNDLRVSADNPTPEYTKALREYGLLDKELARLRGQRGDKIVPKRGRPRVSRSQTSRSSSSSAPDWSEFAAPSSGGSSSSGGTDWSEFAD